MQKYIKELKNFFDFKYFNIKYKLKVKVKRNIVSERICELIIIINGENAANNPVYN